jgi:prolyl-tRNA synthetase
LAVPVVKGKKSDDERFAGAYFTTTTEIYVPISGRGIQGATSHQLGTNFAKMFEVQYEDQKGVKKDVWQTSWGLSTRSIGAMIMVHSDNMGLVLPPRVAQVQVVIIPILKKGDDMEALSKNAQEVYDKLKKAGVKVVLDDRENYNPGFKFNHWEVKGTPIRLELGKKDFEKQEMRCCKRHNGEKFQLKTDTLDQRIPEMLEEIHHEMFNKALKAR